MPFRAAAITVCILAALYTLILRTRYRKGISGLGNAREPTQEARKDAAQGFTKGSRLRTCLRHIVLNAFASYMPRK
eukprot:scaffold19709_cov78-Skeletonema_dohrnii-CCMP3373.AAC.2